MKHLAVVIVVLLLLILAFSRENFSTRREKANAISEWFNTTTDHRYNDYKKSVPDSDIVEYESVRAKYNSGITPATVEGLI